LVHITAAGSGGYHELTGLKLPTKESSWFKVLMRIM